MARVPSAPPPCSFFTREMAPLAQPLLDLLREHEQVGGGWCLAIHTLLGGQSHTLAVWVVGACPSSRPPLKQHGRPPPAAATPLHLPAALGCARTGAQRARLPRRPSPSVLGFGGARETPITK